MRMINVNYRGCNKYAIKPHLDALFIAIKVWIEIAEQEAIVPSFLVQVQEHLLLKLVFAIVESNGIVVAIKTMNQSLEYGGECG